MRYSFVDCIAVAGDALGAGEEEGLKAPALGGLAAARSVFPRDAVSQTDMPTRASSVMAVVTPLERAAAPSFAVMPRSVAAAAGPATAGAT